MFQRMILGFLLLMFALFGVVRVAEAAGQRQKLELQDGSVLIGVIVQMNRFFVKIRTRHGTLKVQRSSIRAISFVGRPLPVRRKRRLYKKVRKKRRFKRQGDSFYTTKPVYRYQNPNQGFLTAGLIIFPIGYAFSLLASTVLVNTNRTSTAGNGSAAGYVMLIPVAGPWIALAMSVGDRSLSGLVPIWTLLGVAQGAGAVFLALGLTAKKKRVRIARELRGLGGVRVARKAALPVLPQALGSAQVLGQFD